MSEESEESESEHIARINEDQYCVHCMEYGAVPDFGWALAHMREGRIAEDNRGRLYKLLDGKLLASDHRGAHWVPLANMHWMPLLDTAWAVIPNADGVE